ncbi:MAG: PTS sugar transporter subunit IIA [Carnobacterium sp.]|nr:PTS sugar transporter subunit IIA [Carnobacterium sp.]
MLATNSDIVNPLFLPDSIFLSEQTSKEAVFKDVSEQLVKKGLVKETFLENLIKREESFPTGMDLFVVNPSLPNIGIPHTEGEFVNTRCIIPVKLMTPVTFNNMIHPSATLEVSFLFMILNNDPGAQTNILSDIMGFISTVDPKQLNEFFNYTDTEKIYQFLQEKF